VGTKVFKTTRPQYVADKDLQDLAAAIARQGGGGAGAYIQMGFNYGVISFYTWRRLLMLYFGR
jgi:hypothetical protein